MTPTSSVTAIRAWDVSLPLPRPVVLGSVVYETRDLVAVEAWDASGRCGSALGYSRGTPLFEAVELLAPRVIGSPLVDPGSAYWELKKGLAPGWAALVRAASLLDCARWDLAATAAGLPLWRLLNAEAPGRSVPVVAVLGYNARERGSADVIDEAHRRLDEGYQRLKLILPGVDWEADLELVASIRSALPRETSLGVDAHGSWTDVDDAVAVGRAFDAWDLAFIEDPFRPDEWRRLRQLRQAIETPIAAGEDAPGWHAHLDVLEGADILRIDATACGGITEMTSSISSAADQSRSVLPHVFPGLHRHLAWAFEAVEAVEVIPPDAGADAVDSVLLDGPLGPELKPTDDPGCGIALDHDALVATSRRSLDLSQSGGGAR